MSRVSKTWVGARCEYCDAEWTASELGRPLVFDYEADAIVCARGRGCARRRPEHERQGERGREYLFEGHWYSSFALAAIAGVSHQTMCMRLAHGWTLAHALAPRVEASPRTAEYRRALALAVIRAGGVSYWVPTQDMRGRPGLVRGVSAAARAAGMAPGTLGDRVRRLGSLEAALACKGRGPYRKLSEPLSRIAQRLGVSREAIYRAAKRRGTDTAQEVARRLAERSAA